MENSITVSLTNAERIYELYKIVQFADRHFHSCQSANFRQHIVSTCSAPNVKKAFESLKADIDRTKGGE